jgi:predicted dehydrogenase
VPAEKLSTFGDAWDVPSDGLYTDLDAMLSAENLDVVSVCTPSFLHHEHILAVARSDASPDVVWCEKPIASAVGDAEEMIAACDDAGIELVVNHSFRFTSKQIRLRELLQEEDLLGDVHSVSAQYRMELLRNSTHLLDTLVYLLDVRAERVSGYVTGENEAIDSLDTSQPVDDAAGGGFVVMDDGTFVTIDCTIPRADSSMTIQFIGSNGKLYMNNDDGEWRYWRLADGEHVEEPLPGIEGAWTWDDDYRGSLVNAAGHIEKMLHGDAENPSTGEDALRSLEIIVAIYLSEYTGGQIDVPLERPLRDVEITSW